jgi:hypothetical protein
MAPAIYLLDDNQEATGTVYHFCSESCRERYRVQEGPLAFGESDDFIDASACDECGKMLVRQ